MKTIKLTTEQAQQLYAKDPTFRDTILHEFTDEELGIEPKAFTWYDLDDFKGCYIDHMSKIEDSYAKARNVNRNIYPCKQDAEQALAKCMVLQLARHYNGCEQYEIEGLCYKAFWDKGEQAVRIFDSYVIINEIVKFIRKSDLKKCIKDNEELFKTMLGVNL